MKVILGVQNKLNRLALLKIIKKLKHEVILCSNPDEIWRELGFQNNSHLLLIDKGMKDQCGAAFLQNIKKLKSKSFFHVIFISSRINDINLKKSVASGIIDDILVKPILPSQIQTKLNIAYRMIGLQYAISNQKTYFDKSLGKSIANALDEMSLGISHEVNNSLTLINGFAQQLQSQTPTLEKKVLEATDMIHRHSKRIYVIVRKLLDYSNLPQNYTYTRIVNLNDVIDDIRLFCKERFYSRQIDVQITQIPEQTLILCRPAQIASIFIYLFKLASDSLSQVPSQKRKIEVSLSIKNDKICQGEITFSENSIKPHQERVAYLYATEFSQIAEEFQRLKGDFSIQELLEKTYFTFSIPITSKIEK